MKINLIVNSEKSNRKAGVLLLLALKTPNTNNNKQASFCCRLLVYKVNKSTVYDAAKCEPKHNTDKSSRIRQYTTKDRT